MNLWNQSIRTKFFIHISEPNLILEYNRQIKYWNLFIFLFWFFVDMFNSSRLIISRIYLILKIIFINIDIPIRILNLCLFWSFEDIFLYTEYSMYSRCSFKISTSLLLRSLSLYVFFALEHEKSLSTQSNNNSEAKHDRTCLGESSFPAYSDITWAWRYLEWDEKPNTEKTDRPRTRPVVPAESLKMSCPLCLGFSRVWDIWALAGCPNATIARRFDTTSIAF